MSYTTQMDSARQGIITPEMEIVAAKESMDVEVVEEQVAEEEPQSMEEVVEAVEEN